jgi:DNA-binding transcriptional ArsR family regulator
MKAHIPHPIPTPLAELIARRFRALGDSTRIRLLDRLATSTSQQNVSKHLAVLMETGIVGRRKDGNRAYYGIVDDTVFALCETVCGGAQRQLSELQQILDGAGR